MNSQSHDYRLSRIREALAIKKSKRLADLQESYKRGLERFSFLSQDPEFMLGLGLYWGEGYKKGNDEVGFSNSDPKMLSVIKKWFEDFFKIDSDRFVCRLSIHEKYYLDESRIIALWSSKINIPSTKFTKTSFVKAPWLKIYDSLDRTEYLGVLRLKIHSGSHIKQEILGLIEAASRRNETKYNRTPQTPDDITL